RGAAYQRLGIQNHGNRHVRINLSMSFGNDFADLFEVRGMRRRRRGKLGVTVDAATAMLDYAGLDGVARRTSLRFDPMPNRLDLGIGTYVLEMPPGARTSVFLIIECSAGAAPSRSKPFFRGMHAAFRERKIAAQGLTTIRTSNELLNKVLCRSMADL